MLISETVNTVSCGLCTYANQTTLNRTHLKSLCRLADLVGFGVALATGMQYLESFPERVYKSMLIPLMIEDKRTGKNTHHLQLTVFLWFP